MKLLYVSISAKTDCLHHRWCVVSKLWIREDLNDLLNKIMVAFRSETQC